MLTNNKLQAPKSIGESNVEPIIVVDTRPTFESDKDGCLVMQYVETLAGLINVSPSACRRLSAIHGVDGTASSGLGIRPRLPLRQKT